MERFCSHCHATLAQDFLPDWCPVCGGALAERDPLPSTSFAPVEIDHRGIELPRRHPLGGIITPQ